MAYPTPLVKCNLATEINILEQTICIAQPCILHASNSVDDQAFFARDTSFLFIAASQLSTLGESPKRSYVVEGERCRFILAFISPQILVDDTGHSSRSMHFFKGIKRILANNGPWSTLQRNSKCAFNLLGDLAPMRLRPGASPRLPPFSPSQTDSQVSSPRRAKKLFRTFIPHPFNLPASGRWRLLPCDRR